MKAHIPRFSGDVVNPVKWLVGEKKDTDDDNNERVEIGDNKNNDTD